MATKPNNTGAIGASVQNASPKAITPLSMRGYLITEENDYALKDLGEALDAIATLCDERQDDVPEMSKAMWGGLFRTFARQTKAIHADAAFANSAIARPRNFN